MRLCSRSSLLLAVTVAPVLLAGACAEEHARPRQPPRRTSDKAALYADAALLPTRAGERARNEVALAEEVRVAVETLHAVESARVTVSTDAHGSPRSAAVVIRAHRAAAQDALTASATRISRAALGGTPFPIDVQVSTPSGAEASPAQTPTGHAPNAALLFGVLGLGISLGLTFDRATGIMRRRLR